MDLQGIVPVLATPFDADENIDEKSLRKEVDFAIEGGATAVCTPGFSSEFYKLSDPERYRVAHVVIEQTKRRVPVIVSTGSGSVHATIEFSRYAESIGADGLMVLPPKSASVGVNELAFFYERVCNSVNLPIMLQDADFSGTGLPAKLFIDLAQRCPNFRFAKLEIPLPGQKCEEIIRQSEGRIQVLLGLWGIYMAGGFEHGSSGIMAGAGFTELYAQIIQLHRSKRTQEWKSLFYRFQPYMVFCLQHMEIATTLDKRTLMQRGIIPSHRLREPTLHLDASYEREMDELIDLGVHLCKECRDMRNTR